MAGQCDELIISTKELMRHRLSCVAPTISQENHYKGVVAVEVIVDADGDVTCAKVLRFAPEGIRQAVEATVKKWKFRPFKIDGYPKRVTGILALAITDNPDITCGKSEKK
jgi:TonB family protein